MDFIGTTVNFSLKKNKKTKKTKKCILNSLNVFEFKFWLYLKDKSS